MLWLIPVFILALGIAAYALCRAQKRKTPPFELESESETPAAEDPSATVLVGALSSAMQLYVSLAHNFYHAPAALVGDGYKSIKYVAIYQSRRFFGQEAGVRYWGKVATARKLPRHEITEIDKGGRGTYIRFEIESWQELNPIILPRGKGITVAFTNRSLLNSARDMNELLGR